MKVLIAYDGSECADAAIDDLKRAGLPDKGEAVVLCVSNVWPQLAEPPIDVASAGAGEWWTPAMADVKRIIETESGHCRGIAASAAERFRSSHPGWNVILDTAIDSPASAIIQKADKWKPDLIVLGSHGRGAMGRLFLGSVSQSVLTHARCAVRIGRRSRQAEGPVHVLLGIDGSRESAVAVSAVAMRKWPAGSEVRATIAIDSAMSTALPLRGLEGESRMQTVGDLARQMVKRVAGELHESGVFADPVVCTGDPTQQLIEQAEKWNADCIFVGAKGLRGLERFLIGSVSASVAARAHCSVEVVRQSAY